MCDNLDGDFAPFCLPINGSKFSPGDRFLITWDPAWFKSPDVIVQVGAEISLDMPNGGSMSEGGWGDRIKVSEGAWEWQLYESQLDASKDLNGLVHFAAYDTEDGLARGIDGPKFVLLGDPNSPNTANFPTATEYATPSIIDYPYASGDSAITSSSTSSPAVHPAAIAVPVVVAVLSFFLVGWWVWRRQRRAQAKENNWVVEHKNGMSSTPSVSSVQGAKTVFNEKVQKQDDEKH